MNLSPFVLKHWQRRESAGGESLKDEIKWRLQETADDFFWAV